MKVCRFFWEVKDKNLLPDKDEVPACKINDKDLLPVKDEVPACKIKDKDLLPVKALEVIHQRISCIEFLQYSVTEVLGGEAHINSFTPVSTDKECQLHYDPTAISIGLVLSNMPSVTTQREWVELNQVHQIMRCIIPTKPMNYSKASLDGDAKPFILINRLPGELQQHVLSFLWPNRRRCLTYGYVQKFNENEKRQRALQRLRTVYAHVDEQTLAGLVLDEYNLPWFVQAICNEEMAQYCKLKSQLSDVKKSQRSSKSRLKALTDSCAYNRQRIKDLKTKMQNLQRAPLAVSVQVYRKGIAGWFAGQKTLSLDKLMSRRYIGHTVAGVSGTWWQKDQHLQAEMDQFAQQSFPVYSPNSSYLSALRSVWSVWPEVGGSEVSELFALSIVLMVLGICVQAPGFIYLFIVQPCLLLAAVYTYQIYQEHKPKQPEQHMHAFKQHKVTKKVKQTAKRLCTGACTMERFETARCS